MAIVYGRNRLLVCRLAGGLDIVGAEKALATDSPLGCLNAATGAGFGLIILCCPDLGGPELDDITALCECLHGNPQTRPIPLFASVAGLRRDAVARLKAAGVGFIAARAGAAPLDVAAIARRVVENDPSWRIDAVLARLCPFLTYIPIDAACAMTACRAYASRLVLAGPRLREVCQSQGHRRCAYYLRPRPAS